MRSLREIEVAPHLVINRKTEDGFLGMVVFDKWTGSIVCSWGGGWEHISISPRNRRYTPTWDDMCRIKQMLFKEDEAVIQIHPATKDYVNLVENCLHLWRPTREALTLPPRWMVGPTEGMDIDEIIRLTEMTEEEKNKYKWEA